MAFGRPSQLPDYHGSLTVSFQPKSFAFFCFIFPFYTVTRPKIVNLLNSGQTPPPVLQPMTLTEQLASYYQKLRRIDSAIHDSVMRKYADQAERLRKISAVFHGCGEQLESWRLGWNAVFDPLQQSGMAEGLVSNPARLKQWGDLEYYRTLLLLQRLSPSAAISAPERLRSLHLFLQAYRDIYYDSATAASNFLSDPSAALNAYLYPSFWTCAQNVLSAALDLVQLKEHSKVAIMSQCFDLASRYLRFSKVTLVIR
jgi:hypothetical protein